MFVSASIPSNRISCLHLGQVSKDFAGGFGFDGMRHLTIQALRYQATIKRTRRLGRFATRGPVRRGRFGLVSFPPH
jgi:hypothetical protein